MGIGAGLVARVALDALMLLLPDHSRLIDVVGQFLVALAIIWLCLIPIFEDYGVIRQPDGG